MRFSHKGMTKAEDDPIRQDGWRQALMNGKSHPAWTHTHCMGTHPALGRTPALVCMGCCMGFPHCMGRTGLHGCMSRNLT